MARSAQPDDALLTPLTEALQRAVPARVLVAWSGGPDSTALLHACMHAAADVPVLAVHVNHGLQDAADDMAAWCESQAVVLGAVCKVLTLSGAPDAGDSIEAWAREQRYSALAGELRAGDVLLTGHHADDQAESVLLALLRGSGLPGMAGLAESVRLGAGILLRPWKAVPRAQLAAYAKRHALRSFADPSNADKRYMRNWVRAEVLPALTERFPAASQALARTATHAAEAQGLLAELATQDLLALDADADSIDLQALHKLSAARQRNVLRHWITQRGWRPPSTAVMHELLGSLTKAAADAQPTIEFGGLQVRRHRERLYVSAGLAELPAHWRAQWRGQTCKLPADLGVLTAQATGDWLVRLPQPGDVVTQRGRPRKALTRWCQEQGVPVWLRSRVPLTFADDQLCGIGGKVIVPDIAPIGLTWQSRLPGAQCLAA